jgi:hypothetical protein
MHNIYGPKTRNQSIPNNSQDFQQSINITVKKKSRSPGVPKTEELSSFTGIQTFEAF